MKYLIYVVGGEILGFSCLLIWGELGWPAEEKSQLPSETQLCETLLNGKQKVQANPETEEL